jgi:hypothetical protein
MMMMTRFVVALLKQISIGYSAAPAVKRQAASK